jgi:hypothetical protein
MSVVTNVILACPPLVKSEKREIIKRINKWLKEYNLGKIGQDADLVSGGTKHLECDLFIGAFNGLPLEEFLGFIFSMPCEDVDRFQIFAKEQDDDVFQLYDYSRSKKGIAYWQDREESLISKYLSEIEGLKHDIGLMYKTNDKLIGKIKKLKVKE